jgi:hypothetical protein
MANGKHSMRGHWQELRVLPELPSWDDLLHRYYRASFRSERRMERFAIGRTEQRITISIPSGCVKKGNIGLHGLHE